MAGVQWVGSDGNRYVKDSSGTRNVGAASAGGGTYWINQGYPMISDPVNYSQTGGLWDGENATADQLQADTSAWMGGEGSVLGSQYGGSTTGGSTGRSGIDMGLVNQLRNEISAKGGEVDSVYGELFGALDGLLKSRDAELESEYGGQLKKASDTYADAIPEIETSYAAIGASDSTDRTSANRKADAGFKETTETIGKNKSSDKAKLGQYGNEQRAKITADKDSAKRNVARAGETTDADSLRSMRNEIETNTGNARVTKATLSSDGQAQADLKSLTGDNGRFDSAINALDSIIKGSMSGAVKEAAVKAVVDNAGLSDEEKKKVQQTYGNVYAEQAAL